MVEIQGHTEDIKGCVPSIKYQKYYNDANRKYFEGQLPVAKVLAAPLLKITQLSQKSAKDKKNWKHAGNYGLTGYDENGDLCIILDKGTSIFHSILTKQTVLHEMCHINIGLNEKHGKLFKAQIRRLAALGALDNLI